MQKSRKHTLIVARRELTVANTALADVILEFLSARFKASMVVLNAEIASSHSLGR